MIRSGVRRNPPPTPKRPESKPTARPRPTGIRILMLVSATGRYKCISITPFNDMRSFLATEYSEVTEVKKVFTTPIIEAFLCALCELCGNSLQLRV
jgi:hypothetical protein